MHLQEGLQLLESLGLAERQTVQYARRDLANRQRARNELGAVLGRFDPVEQYASFVARILRNELANELAGKGDGIG